MILNATGFSVRGAGGARPAGGADCPVLQVVFSGGDEDELARRARAASAPRDLAMNVALPEIDGRILSRAVSFKAPLGRDPETEADLVGYRPVADRVAFVADLARNWARLRAKPPAERRVAIDPRQLPEPRRPHRQRGRPRHAGFGDRDPARAGGGRLPGRRHARRAGAALIDRLLAGPTNAQPGRAGRGTAVLCRLFGVFRDPAALGAAGASSARWGAGRARPVLPPGAARLRPVRDPGVSAPAMSRC